MRRNLKATMQATMLPCHHAHICHHFIISIFFSSSSSFGVLHYTFPMLLSQHKQERNRRNELNHSGPHHWDMCRSRKRGLTFGEVDVNGLASLFGNGAPQARDQACHDNHATQITMKHFRKKQEHLIGGFVTSFAKQAPFESESWPMTMIANGTQKQRAGNARALPAALCWW